MDVQYWRNHHLVQRALQRLSDHAPVLETALAVQQIPAPTFDERRRSEFVLQHFHKIGLSHIECDDIGNVYGCRPGVNHRSALLIAAHIDTVFPHDTDLSIRVEGDTIYAPGLGDNSLGVAGLLHLAQAMQKEDLPNQGDIWFVADVGEEGLGDLRGMRAAMDRLEGRIGRAIALEGCPFGVVHHQAIGVRRYRIDVEAPGGHSWGSFGNPSAIHTLVRLAARITDIKPPPYPRTTYNLGVISGGTTVNSIAEHASLLLDMRSGEDGALKDLVTQVDRLIAEARDADPRVHITVTTVSDRPVGSIPRDHPLVQAAAMAYSICGARVGYQQSSTDANIPLSRGIPAICVGLADGGNAHRHNEYIKSADLAHGMQALLLLTMAASSCS